MSNNELEKLVSVIIPVYNSEKTILRAIESVINQTYKYTEIIVVDDGSTDQSSSIVKDIIQLYPDIKIDYYYQINSGAANARNKGIINSNGNYVAFLDSDDNWFVDKLATQIEIFNIDAEVGMVGAYTNMINSYFNNNRKMIDEYYPIKYHQMLVSNRFQTSTVVIKKDVFEDVGLFPFNQKHAEEGDLFLRIVYKYKSIMINKVLVNYSNGKAAFGQAGLSSNINSMWFGELLNYHRAHKRKEINYIIYAIILVYSFIKYIRRKYIFIFNTMRFK